MYWSVIVGLTALLALLMAAIVLVLFIRKQRKEGILPDGDYVATIVCSEETPEGTVTLFRIDEPLVHKGRVVKIVRGPLDKDDE